MKIKTIHQLKLPNQHKIKGINWVLNRVVGKIENSSIRKSAYASCVKGHFNDSNKDCKAIVDINKPIVLSMTTYPAREEKVYFTIKSLLRQNTAVDKFIVWLDEAEYKQVPDRLKKFEDLGVEFCFCGSLRSHKKYFYAMQQFSDSIIITVDDDVIYPENTVEKLINMHKQFPDCVICNQGRWIKIDDNCFAPYSQWTTAVPQNITEPSFMILPIGEGGVLYPPHCLSDEVFNSERLEKSAFTADDLWLKFMAVKNNTKAMVSQRVQRNLCAVTTADNENSSLNSINVAGGKNDLVIKELSKYYPEVLKIIKDNQC